MREGGRMREVDQLIKTRNCNGKKSMKKTDGAVTRKSIRAGCMCFQNPNKKGCLRYGANFLPQKGARFRAQINLSVLSRVVSKPKPKYDLPKSYKY